MRTLNSLGLCRLLLASLVVSQLSLAVQPLRADEPPWYERQSDWNGFEQFHFTVAERPAYLVAPETAAAGRPWVWRARFPNYHAEMDVLLLRKGFHIAYVDVAGLFGGPQAMRVGDAFHQYLTQQRGLAPKPALEGVSRGGLLVYNWAARHPDLVACIYCDTPVCDFKSWPGGLGAGPVRSPTGRNACSNTASRPSRRSCSGRTPSIRPRYWRGPESPSCTSSHATTAWFPRSRIRTY